MAGCWLEEEVEVTRGDPSPSASHIKESAEEQVGRAGGQPQPMETGERGGGRSITAKSSGNVAVKWVRHRAGRGGQGVAETYDCFKWALESVCIVCLPVGPRLL